MPNAEKPLIVFISVILMFISAAGVNQCRAVQMSREAADVAQHEFGAKESLRKYEWFKDAAAQLNAKRADIGVFEARLASLDAQYKDEKRSAWNRADLDQYNVTTTELLGVKASYNNLAAEYNAQMAKVNWAFANAGSLPAGASDPLPREFSAYLDK